MGLRIKLLLLSILFQSVTFTNAFADDTVTSYPPQGVLVFKGLDNTSSPLIIQDNRASDIQNITLSNAFTAKKRYGYKVVGDRINHYVIGVDYFPAVTGLYYTKLSSGTDYIYSICGERFYYNTSGVWTWQNSTSPPSYDPNNQFIWTTALDTVILSDNVDAVKKITNGSNFGTLSFSSLSASIRPTAVKCLTWYKNYLILGNTTETSISRTTRIRWSDVGTIETWSDDNYNDIAELGGQQIEAFVQLYDSLYILFTDSIWEMSLVGGDEIFTFRKVIDGIGCIAKNSVQTINFLNQRKGIIFLAKDKRIYFFDGNNIVDISALIHGSLDKLNPSRLQYAVSAVDNNNYYLSVTTGSSSNVTNNLVFNLQTEIGEWTKHTKINANAMFAVVDEDDNPQVYFGNYDSFVYKLNDSSLSSDVAGLTNQVSSVTTYTLPDSTATGLQMLILDTTVTDTASGAIVRITSGTGVGEEKVCVYSSSTSVVVDSAFSSTPDSTSLISVGDIPAYYKTKWFDLGSAIRLKLLSELYFWADSESSSVYVDLSYATDFSSDSDTNSISLESLGGKWGTAVWGTSVWGGEDAVFKTAKLNGEGRYARLTFENNNVGESFNLYAYSILYWLLDYK